MINNYYPPKRGKIVDHLLKKKEALLAAFFVEN